MCFRGVGTILEIEGDFTETPTHRIKLMERKWTILEKYLCFRVYLFFIAERSKEIKDIDKGREKRFGIPEKCSGMFKYYRKIVKIHNSIKLLECPILLGQKLS